MIKDIGTEGLKCLACNSPMHIEKNDLGDEILCCNRCQWLYDVEETKKILDKQNKC